MRRIKVSFIPNSVPYSHLHRPPVPASYNRSIFQTCSRLLARSIFRPNLASLFDCPLDFRPSHLVLIGFQHQRRRTSSAAALDALDDLLPRFKEHGVWLFVLRSYAFSHHTNASAPTGL
ncbi:hypothetical protein L1987_30939 [Smallanthus sonchifolius]|uniref:Uncharacterized protein n=1 Tax=Smallanthus sonchifolius TaxID=185202 RepID=A0ACB9I5P5_9ASTR|nr:hypothetical protein L1987_30939 [Smallanthus sonchifolius]